VKEEGKEKGRRRKNEKEVCKKKMSGKWDE
jgi:hypothetical protein